MAKFLTKLIKLTLKISLKYLIFIFILIGCSYQVIQVIKVYLEFETKVDVSFDSKNQNVILIFFS